MYYGVGFKYDGIRDVMSQFVEEGMVCVGYSPQEKPAYHNLLRNMQIGDVVFLKSHTPKQGLFVHAVGIVATHDFIQSAHDLGHGRKVTWMRFFDGLRFGTFSDGSIHRGGSIFREENPTVIRWLANALAGWHPLMDGEEKVVGWDSDGLHSATK